MKMAMEHIDSIDMSEIHVWYNYVRVTLQYNWQLILW